MSVFTSNEMKKLLLILFALLPTMLLVGKQQHLGYSDNAISNKTANIALCSNGNQSCAGLGGVTGALGGYAYAKENGLNPWTGEAIQATPQELGIQSTLDRIERGEAFPHKHDGTHFENREGYLPSLEKGHYTEYVHPTHGITGAGSQRIVISPDGHIYYTPDHYQTFLKIK
jgi:guanyl-specific ribonuclease Sa